MGSAYLGLDVRVDGFVWSRRKSIENGIRRLWDFEEVVHSGTQVDNPKLGYLSMYGTDYGSISWLLEPDILLEEVTEIVWAANKVYCAVETQITDLDNAPTVETSSEESQFFHWTCKQAAEAEAREKEKDARIPKRRTSRVTNKPADALRKVGTRAGTKGKKKGARRKGARTTS